jgi:hypothetical protein
MVAKQRLGGRAHAEAFLKLFVAAVSDPCHFRRETFDMVLLLLEQPLRDEHRHIDVFVTGLLEARV